MKIETKEIIAVFPEPEIVLYLFIEISSYSHGVQTVGVNQEKSI